MEGSREKESTRYLPTPMVPDNVYGYRYYWLCNEGPKRKTFRGGRLVLLNRVGPPPTPKHECCHKNGNRWDDRLSNIYWGTKIENNADQDLHGTRIRGDRHPSRTNPENLARGDAHSSTKIPDAQIPVLLSLYKKEGWTQKQLALKYGVTQALISLIVRGKHRPP